MHALLWRTNIVKQGNLRPRTPTVLESNTTITDHSTSSRTEEHTISSTYSQPRHELLLHIYITEHQLRDTPADTLERRAATSAIATGLGLRLRVRVSDKFHMIQCYVIDYLPATIPIVDWPSPPFPSFNPCYRRPAMGCTGCCPKRSFALRES